MKRSIREERERWEEEHLSEYAQQSRLSEGRAVEEESCPIRTEYQRDRDRIIHSKAFRRLKHKTHVFIAPIGDHYRTRLTHTLEVAQIARTIARALRLNEDLTEAIALAHDLGHTPFGHIGEQVLDRLNPGGFRHYEQSVRVITFLEKKDAGRPGLNPTAEVIDGVAMHTGDNIAKTLEGKIIKLSDRIAYINHDIDDAIRAGVLVESDLPKEVTRLLGKRNSERIHTLVADVIENSWDKNEISMSPPIYEAMMELREFMFERVYLNRKVKEEEDRAHFVIEMLYRYYQKNMDALPPGHLEIYRDDPVHCDDPDDRVITDYIAGMTDKYVMQVFNDVFIPKAWKS